MRSWMSFVVLYHNPLPAALTQKPSQVTIEEEDEEQMRWIAITKDTDMLPRAPSHILGRSPPPQDVRQGTWQHVCVFDDCYPQHLLLTRRGNMGCSLAAGLHVRCL